MSEGLLSELLVIDLAQGVAGAYCCLLLRHLGAEVISVERPSGKTAKTSVPSYLNADKKSITLDFTRPEGATLLRRLAEHADILIEDGAELDYDALSHQNPRLLLTAITNASPAGDDAAELFVGLNAFAATLAPLVNMSVIGRGQRIEVDGEECLATAAFVSKSAGESEPKVNAQEGGAVPQAPFQMMGLVPLSPAPRPCESNDAVYGGLLALSGEELARLKEQSIV